MKIAICGSMRFAKEMVDIAKSLESLGHIAYNPGHDQKVDLERYKEAGNTQEAIKSKVDNDYIRAHYYVIQKSDCILVLNYDKDGVKNYIGANTLLEMGFALILNKPIFLLRDFPDQSYINSEIRSMHAVVINNDLSLIK